ncbi:1856_t:CDS:2, partial [Entrophospora sp. SA101]
MSENTNNSQQENPSLPWNADNTVKNEEINNNNLNYTSIIINTTINATIAAANNNNVPLCNNTDDDNINIINTTSDNHNETILGNNDRSTISLTSPMDCTYTPPNINEHNIHKLSNNNININIKEEDEGGELEGCGDDNNNNIEDDGAINNGEIGNVDNNLENIDTGSMDGSIGGNNGAYLMAFANSANRIDPTLLNYDNNVSIQNAINNYISSNSPHSQRSTTNNFSTMASAIYWSDGAATTAPNVNTAGNSVAIAAALQQAARISRSLPSQYYTTNPPIHCAPSTSHLSHLNEINNLISISDNQINTAVNNSINNNSINNSMNDQINSMGSINSMNTTTTNSSSVSPLISTSIPSGRPPSSPATDANNNRSGKKKRGRKPESDYHLLNSSLSSSTTDVIRQAEIAQCSNCGVRDTPAWRRDLQGISLLCNACGIRRPTELAPDGTIRLMRTQRLEPEFTCNNCGMRNTPCWKGPEGQKL